MALFDRVPLPESLGVFVGVAGFGWLTEGQAQWLNAILAAVIGGILIMGLRCLRRPRSGDERRPTDAR